MATEKRLIDANKFIKSWEMSKAIAGKIPGELGEILCNMYDEVIEKIKEQPTVDAVEVVHGRWEDEYGGKYATPPDIGALLVRKRHFINLRRTS